MNLTETAQALALSRSGYHAHQRRHLRPRRVQDAALSTEIHAAFVASRRTYGSPRVRHALRARGLQHGQNRIARLMREQGLRGCRKGRYIPRTTVAGPAAGASANLLLARPAPQRPDEVWLTDITYLPTREGWLFLAAEMDLCSRRIVGWETSASLATPLVSAALEHALAARALPPHSLRQLLHHSDRGCQYSSGAFRARLALRGITQSMSRPANCYDNAAMESFWATLKAEAFGSVIPATRAEARSLIFDYIVTFYNPVRLHSALGYQSPVAFELSILNKIP